jgi:hypothetical protein
MPELTMEALAARLAVVERELAELKSGHAPKNGWRQVVGMFDEDPEFMQQVIAEGAAIRQADREAGRSGIVK